MLPSGLQALVAAPPAAAPGAPPAPAPDAGKVAEAAAGAVVTVRLGAGAAQLRTIPLPTPPPSAPILRALTQGSLLLVPSLGHETKYVVQVRARNARGWGPWCAKAADGQTRPLADKHAFESTLLAVAKAWGSSVPASAAPVAKEAPEGKAASKGADTGAAGTPKKGAQPSPLSSAALGSATADGAGTPGGFAVTPQQQQPSLSGLGEEDIPLSALTRDPSLAQLRSSLIALVGKLQPLTVQQQAAPAADEADDGGSGVTSALDSHLFTAPLRTAAATWAAGAPSTAAGGQFTRSESATRYLSAVAGGAAHGNVDALAWLCGGAPTAGAPKADGLPAAATGLRVLLCASTASAAAPESTTPVPRSAVHMACLGDSGPDSAETLQWLLATATSGVDGNASGSVREALVTSLRSPADGVAPVHLAAFAYVPPSTSSTGPGEFGSEAAPSPLSIALHACADSSPASLLLHTDTAHGWGVLQYAALSGHPEALQAVAAAAGVPTSGPPLAAIAAGEEHADSTGRGVAHVAAGGDGAAVLSWLWERTSGPSNGNATKWVASVDSAGRTPLHYAALAGASSAAAWLLMKLSGAATAAAKDGGGHTPAALATAAGHGSLAALLSAAALAPAPGSAGVGSPTKARVSRL